MWSHSVCLYSFRSTWPTVLQMDPLCSKVRIQQSYWAKRTPKKSVRKRGTKDNYLQNIQPLPPLNLFSGCPWWLWPITTLADIGDWHWKIAPICSANRKKTRPKGGKMPAMKSQLFFVAFAWLNGTIFQSQTHTKQYKWKGVSRIPTLSHSQARSFWEKSGDLPFFIIVCWDRFPLAYIHRVISLVIWKATARLRVVCNFGMEYESGLNARTRARLLESPRVSRVRVYFARSLIFSQN